MTRATEHDGDALFPLRQKADFDRFRAEPHLRVLASDSFTLTLRSPAGTTLAAVRGERTADGAWTLAIDGASSSAAVPNIDLTVARSEAVFASLEAPGHEALAVRFELTGGDAPRRYAFVLDER